MAEFSISTPTSSLQTLPLLNPDSASPNLLFSLCALQHEAREVAYAVAFLSEPNLGRLSKATLLYDLLSIVNGVRYYVLFWALRGRELCGVSKGGEEVHIKFGWCDRLSVSAGEASSSEG